MRKPQNILLAFGSLWICILLFTGCESEELGSSIDPSDDEVVITDDEGEEQEEEGFLGEIDFLITLGGSEEDEAVDVVEVPSGYVVAGSTRSTDGDLSGRVGNDWDYWVLMTDRLGNTQWQQTYGGSEDDRLASIKATSDGGFVLSGYSQSTDGDVSDNAGFHDFWIVKIDGGGTILWEHNFGFPGSDQAFDVIETSDGGYLATGFLDVDESDGEGNDNRATQHGVGDFWAIKMDADGEWIWRRYFGGTDYDRASQAVELSDGNYLLFGASESDDFDITDSKGSYDYWAVKVSPDGDMIWTRSYGGSQIDIGSSAAQSSSGRIYLAGDVRSADGDISSPLGNADIWLASIDEDGNLLDERSLGGTAFESARSVVTSGEDIVLAGSTRSTDGDITDNKGENDAWIVWMNDLDSIEFQSTVGGSSFDFGEAAILTSDQGLLLVGHTESSDGDIALNKGKKDLMIVKFK